MNRSQAASGEPSRSAATQSSIRPPGNIPVLPHYIPSGPRLNARDGTTLGGAVELQDQFRERLIMTKAARKRDESSGNGPPPAETPPESLDKVRDILFGGQMRAVESRLNAAETRLLQGQETVRADLSKQIAQLESTLQKEVQSLGERLAAERTRRTEDLKALEASFKEALRALEKRHSKLEEAAGMADAELREGLLQLTAEFTRAVQELRTQKSDTSAIAGLFADMASRLSGDNRGAGKGATRG